MADYTLFPSLLPDDDTYSSKHLQDEWDYTVLRTVIAAHDTDKVNGKSTKFEMASYLSGRYSRDALDAMREEAQSDDPDLGAIMNSAQGLDAYSNG